MPNPKAKKTKAPKGMRFCKEHNDYLPEDQFYKTLQSPYCKVCRKRMDYERQMAHHDAMQQVHAARENGENLTVARAKRKNEMVVEEPEIFFDNYRQFFCHAGCGTVLQFRGREENLVYLFCYIHEIRFTVDHRELAMMAGL